MVEHREREGREIKRRKTEPRMTPITRMKSEEEINHRGL
jgi:hypothetical protein